MFLFTILMAMIDEHRTRKAIKENQAAAASRIARSNAEFAKLKELQNKVYYTYEDSNKNE